MTIPKMGTIAMRHHEPSPTGGLAGAGLMRSAEERLNDARRIDLSYSSRFDLAYNAAHALALIALRRAGHRSDNRYLVFQALPHTTGLPTEKLRVLAKAHERRNLAEYEGHREHDDRLLAELIVIAGDLHGIAEAAHPRPPRDANSP
jgi:hypothetical protein